MKSELTHPLQLQRNYHGIRSLERRGLIFGLIISDLFFAVLSLQIAYAIRFTLRIPFFRLEYTPSDEMYTGTSLLLAFVLLTTFAIRGLYNFNNLLGGTQEYAYVFDAITTSFFLFIVCDFVLEIGVSRGWLILTWLIACLLVITGRFLARRVIYLLRARGHFQTPAIIVGANEEARLLVEQLSFNKISGVQLQGFIDVSSEDSHELSVSLKCLGSLDNLDKVLEKYEYCDVILISSALSQEKILALYQKYGLSRQINLLMSSGLYEIITTGLHIKEFASVPMVVVNKVRLTGSDQIVKMLTDYAIAIPLLFLISPLIVLIAIAIRLDSPGPVIYRRRVMGVNGRQFDAYKFRTMYIDGDAILARYPELQKELEQNFKLKNDPRITRTGRLLRKTSLDELPQLFNVILGQMSLVGPRMICPKELSLYSQWGMNLLTVKPGITGLWQVSGRSDVTYEQRVKLDMYYIRNWSLWMDIRLILKTIPAVIARRGAY